MVLASLPPFELAPGSLKDSSVLCVLLARTKSRFVDRGRGCRRPCVCSQRSRPLTVGPVFAPSVPPQGPPYASSFGRGSSVICSAGPRHDEAVRGFGSDVALNSLRSAPSYVHHRNSGRTPPPSQL